MLSHRRLGWLHSCVNSPEHLADVVALWHAVNTAHPSVVAPQTTLLRVQRINVAPPSFGAGAPFFLQVFENSPLGTFVGRLATIDAGAPPGGLVIYSLVAAPGASEAAPLPFAVDAQSGNITTVLMIDAEQQPSFDIVITAKDDGSPPLNASAHATIMVLDINEFPPSIAQVTILLQSVPENVIVGTVVARLEFADEDSSPIFIVETSGPAAGKLDVNASTGEVYIKAGIDRETEAQLEVTISVHNGDGLQPAASTDILIEVTDVNDEAPTFVTETLLADVYENASVGTIVTVVAAVDRDADVQNRLFEFSINSTDPAALRLFRLASPTDGTLRLAGMLDYEEQREYRLEVTAVDSGGEIRSQSGVPLVLAGLTIVCVLIGLPRPAGLFDVGEIVVRVLNINDNPPIFTQGAYEGSIVENTVCLFQDIALCPAPDTIVVVTAIVGSWCPEAACC